ncbi:MAG TPA: hypothetical protein VK468_02785, partial [Pyrinomonadaceae bacterium]|nr:hypothetical protein [Pyrinomonadaceae bacterium]
DGVDERELSYARYYQFDHYRPIVESGAVEVAYSKEEMRDLLQKALRHPEDRASERKDLIEEMFGSTLDGCSGARVGAKLVELAGSVR